MRQWERGIREPAQGAVSLDTSFFETRGPTSVNGTHAPERAFARWLSVDQIRKMERMRRETVIEAMESGELPYEQRGRIRYARLSDVLLWEERRLAGTTRQSDFEIDPAFADLAFGSGGQET